MHCFPQMHTKSMRHNHLINNRCWIKLYEFKIKCIISPTHFPVWVGTASPVFLIGMLTGNPKSFPFEWIWKTLGWERWQDNPKHNLIYCSLQHFILLPPNRSSQPKLDMYALKLLLLPFQFNIPLSWRAG